MYGDKSKGKAAKELKMISEELVEVDQGKNLVFFIQILQR